VGALRAPETARTLAAQGLDIACEPPEPFAARLRRETVLRAEVVRARNISVE
jgi:hypothetical protein